MFARRGLTVDRVMEDIVGRMGGWDYNGPKDGRQSEIKDRDCFESTARQYFNY